ncbi:CDP-diacylglycerol--serine O-phosphatidyltransferase [Haematospirillum sp. 15-248]|nr:MULTISPECIES: CDP-diacylglycerol--serine O-phosphatidyltransferase [unclassified Haematospirillum]NKD54567.1 CDP-diacylglycerol--serine O-phosphatidyltransferase [Haematospirillum sp. H4890]NKD74821.1 CDP-diacylglycerol--serine O-phosphatidyltransferase [Haematospirillum sp. H4485]NKD88031.1 CDP-diacylglycerol--serine O-phosphatidyltransferase [Haematospirillum sp. 15-248]
MPLHHTARLQSLSFNKMLPNLITLLALSAGLTSIRYGLRGEFGHAVIAIFFAAVFDGIDGRVARMLQSTSKFGAELDSLSDVVSFGVAPAVLLYMWSMSSAGGIGWAICVLFALCMALRLARFNTMLGEPDLPSYAHNYFVGTPAPAAAFLGVLPMVMSFEFEGGVFSSPWLVGPYMLGVSFLMVSRIPTYSMKRFRIPTRWVLPFMIGIGLLATFLVTEPWSTLGIVGLIYLGSIPFARSSFLRLERRARTGNANEIADSNHTNPEDPEQDVQQRTERPLH